MSHPMSKLLVCTSVAVTFCASVYGAVAVLNAKQLPDDDLFADLELPAAPASAPAAPAAVEAPAAPEAEPAAPAAAPAPADDPLAGLLGDDPAPAAAPVEAPAPVEPAVVEPAVVEVPAAPAEPAVVEVAEAPAPAVEVAAAPAADPLADILTSDPGPAPAPAVEEAPVATVVAEDPAPAVEAASVVEAAPVATAIAAAPVEEVAVAQAEPEAPVVSEEDALVSDLATLTAVRAEAQNQHGLSEYRAGLEALNRGSYDKAIARLTEARKYVFETTVDSKGRNVLDQVESHLAEAYYRSSVLSEQLRNYKESRVAATHAAQLGHPKALAQLSHLDDLENKPPVEERPPQIRRDHEKEYVDRQRTINDHLNRARQFFATGEYDKSRDQLELVLRDNPFNYEAITLLRRLENKTYDLVNHEFEATREEMIREVKQIWTPRTYAAETADITPVASNTSTTNLPSDSVAIEKKMRSIVIPDINFRQANLTDVITFLSDASRENDNDNVPAEKKGINFILQNSGSTAAAPAADPLDPWAQPAEASGGPAGAPSFTFSARYVPLKDVLDIIMQTGNLKYRIRGNVVVIMDKDTPEEDLFFRMYSVLPTLEEKVTTIGTTGSTGGGNDFTMMESPSIQSGTSDWKEFFRKFGVDWPNGSSVEYMRAVGRLVVKNTTENLANLETVLSVLNVTPKQIEVEARFVEVSQADLDSLGFEWNLNNNWEMLEHKDDKGLPADQRRRIVMNNGSFTSGFKYLTDNTTPVINGGSAVADNVLSIGSVLTNPELSVVLHLLSSRENTDLLSAPKVVTQNGQEATIKVVTEYIYPTEYDVEMLESSDDNDNTTYSGAVVQPGSFQTREVGVILTVLPQVNDDGQLINLTLAPQVVSEPTWKNYGSTYPVYAADGSYQMAQLDMEQPFFPVRSITTNIQIYNGATVVMGGMITETRVSHEDKIPFLGDIPLLGRLFRNKYESSEKRNLLIFVSARLVDPAGRFVRDQKDLTLLTEANGGM